MEVSLKRDGNWSWDVDSSDLACGNYETCREAVHHLYMLSKCFMAKFNYIGVLAAGRLMKKFNYIQGKAMFFRV